MSAIRNSPGFCRGLPKVVLASNKNDVHQSAETVSFFPSGVRLDVGLTGRAWRRNRRRRLSLFKGVGFGHPESSPSNPTFAIHRCGPTCCVAPNSFRPSSEKAARLALVSSTCCVPLQQKISLEPHGGQLQTYHLPFPPGGYGLKAKNTPPGHFDGSLFGPLAVTGTVPGLVIANTSTKMMLTAAVW